ncbi:ATP-binding protein [Yinghuangia sp. ASG 101]|uniref:ATP-binding protein n=1 Tax=Yinghuangia sp. ASG 101 TaxID=2896848 RepID=UPI001E55F921|nr:ATP-binding protein [Yinghuangia sp. ASG 101]UGQ14188.1 ATP-binding protein [Yinghuangia sp. ASG 101]
MTGAFAALGESNWTTESRRSVQGGYELRAKTWPVAPSSVRDARNLAWAAVEDWGLSPLADAIELCTSELASNAVRHAVPCVSCRVAVRVYLFPGRFVTVEVDDSDPSRPVLPMVTPGDVPDTSLLSGRGLWLVSREADGLDWWPRPLDGKTVRCWFDLRRYGIARRSVSGLGWSIEQV